LLSTPHSWWQGQIDKRSETVRLKARTCSPRPQHGTPLAMSLTATELTARTSE
jgi:hypothetical protein